MHKTIRIPAKEVNRKMRNGIEVKGIPIPLSSQQCNHIALDKMHIGAHRLSRLHQSRSYIFFSFTKIGVVCEFLILFF